LCESIWRSVVGAGLTSKSAHQRTRGIITYRLAGFFLLLEVEQRKIR